MHRRTFLASAAATALMPAADPWNQVPALLQRIKPPAFSTRRFPVTHFGARPDGRIDCTAGFAKAIAACSAAGGGHVFVPAGEYSTGPVHLKSGVNLHLERGARMQFVRDPQRYLPLVFSRWEGMECMNYSPFLYAYGAKDIAITGEGVLDGGASCDYWWPWKGRTNCGWKRGEPNQAKARDQLIAMTERDVPVEERKFGEGSFLRPQFVQTYKCTNVLIEGVTIVNSPMWEIHPVLCRNVIVRNVKISSHGPNNDGCNPESCTDVLIQGCEFDTGDDCIAIKSGRNRDGRRVNVPTENILIRNCVMKDGHGGVTLGSEISGGVRNVFAEDCRMDSPNLERVLRLKTNSVRGGVLEHIYMRNVQAGQVSGAVVDIDFSYEEGNAGKFAPVVRDVELSNVTCKKSKYGLTLVGYPEAPIHDVRLRDCTFTGVEKASIVQHVDGLRMENVRINGELMK
jgi:polygalacturonase